MGRFILSIIGWVAAWFMAPLILYILLEPVFENWEVWLQTTVFVVVVLVILVVSPVAGLLLNNCIDKMKYGCQLEDVKAGPGELMTQERKMAAMESSAHRWIGISVVMAVSLLVAAVVLLF